MNLISPRQIIEESTIVREGGREGGSWAAFYTCVLMFTFYPAAENIISIMGSVRGMQNIEDDTSGRLKTWTRKSWIYEKEEQTLQKHLMIKATHKI